MRDFIDNAPSENWECDRIVFIEEFEVEMLRNILNTIFLDNPKNLNSLDLAEKTLISQLSFGAFDFT